MLAVDDEITAIDYDDDIQTIVVRTKRQTDFEEKLKKTDPFVRGLLNILVGQIRSHNK